MIPKTYTQEEVDELVSVEEQKSYDAGRKIGRSDGIKACAVLISSDSASAFVAKRDEEARLLRGLSDKLLALLKP